MSISPPPVLTFGVFSVPFSNFPAARESRKSFPFESFHPVFLIFCSTPQLKNMDSDEMLQFFCKFEADKPFLTCRQRPMELYHGSYTAIPSPKILEGSTREQFWILAKFKYPTHQVSFCTQKALTCITYKGFEEVKE